MADVAPDARENPSTSSRRLLVVSHTYVEPTNREKWFALRDLAPHWEITVVTPRSWRDAEFGLRESLAETSGRLRFVPLRTVGQGGGRYLFVIPALVSVMKRLGPDVICVEAEPWSAVCLQVMLLRRWLAPEAALAVFSWWNTPRWTTPLKFPGSVAYAVGRRATDLLIAGNHHAAALHKRHGFSGQVAIIPQLGVDPATHAPGPPDPTLMARYGLESVFVIGFVGRLTVQKGVEVLLNAAALLQDGNWKLLVIGDGPDMGRLRTQSAELGIADHVVFTGAVRREEMPRYLLLMGVLVLPSLEEQWEQFGHVLIEAMACGVAVVGSTSGEIPWVIGDDRVTFRMGDVVALCTILERLRQDPVFADECRARGLGRVQQLYSNGAIARQLHAALEGISQARS